MPTDTPTKPKRPSKLAEPNVTATRGHVIASKALIDGMVESTDSTLASLRQSRTAIGASRTLLNKPGGKLGAEKLTPAEQRRRFMEAARKARASEDEADFDAALKRNAMPKSAS